MRRKPPTPGYLPFLPEETCDNILFQKAGEVVVENDEAFKKKTRLEFSLLKVPANGDEAKLLGISLPKGIDGVIESKDIPAFVYMKMTKQGNLVLKRGRKKEKAGYLITKENSKSACLVYARMYSEKSGTDLKTIVATTKPPEQKKYANGIQEIMVTAGTAACLRFAFIPN